MKRDIKLLIKCFLLAICLVGILSGCSKKEVMIQDNISECELELLKTLTPEFIHKRGIEAEVDLITLDVSEFHEADIEEFNKWVQDQFVNDNTIISIKKDETDQDASDYNINDCDQVVITFHRENREESLHINEKISVNISYITIYASEGFDVEMEYQNQSWIIKKVESTYMS